jgi:hypothetical protein
MRHSLVITACVAALVAGAGLASAQGMKEQPLAPAPEQKAPEGKTDRQKAPPKKVEAVKPGPTAQTPQTPTSPTPQKPIAATPAPAPSERTGAAPTETKPGAPAALSSERHAKFRETIRSEKVEPVTDVHFSITVGEAIPRTVRRHRLSHVILEFAPQYEGYEYILVGDDILIVDPRTLRIVAVIPA